ncbi:hypothetical protein HDV00_003019 [Rhizophlyctis rosea]|nr:hypothetical protein HDV00_003019 [Rhizophlyctis rosea]
MPALFPDHKTVWAAPAAKLDIDLDIVKDFTGAAGAANAEDGAKSETKQEESTSDDDVEIGDHEASGDAEGGVEGTKADRRFQAVDAACAGLLFIRFRVDVSPVDFVLKMFDHVQSLPPKEQKKFAHPVQHCFRFLPITHVCPATLQDIKDTLTPVVQSALSQPSDLSTSVAVIAEVRNNLSVTRDLAIETVAKMIPNNCTINLKNPSKVLFISIFKSVCGFAILPRYYELKKYNLHSVVQAASEKGGSI